MKFNNSNIDELLSCFIDGELTQRQHVEVQRLISHQPELQARLRHLQKGRELISSMPRTKAPPDTVAAVMGAIERKSLFGLDSPAADSTRATSHLFMRKLMSIAAIIVPVVFLAGIIYTIVGRPGPDQHKLVADSAYTKHADSAADSATKAVTGSTINSTTHLVANSAASPGTDSPAGSTGTASVAGNAVAGNSAVGTSAVTGLTTVASSASGLPVSGPYNSVLTARLDLATKDFSAATAFLRRAIENEGLSGQLACRESQNGSAYTITCSRAKLSSLMNQLRAIWGRFDSADLYIETDTFARPVALNAVTAAQALDIIRQRTQDDAVSLAKNFAVTNALSRAGIVDKVLAKMADNSSDSMMPLTMVPRPVLTSNDNAAKLKSTPVKSEDKVEAEFTIVIRKNIR